MTANDLIKLMDRGYAGGEDQCIAANWDFEVGTLGKPQGDILAYYLASVANDYDADTLSGKPDISVLTALTGELTMAIADVSKLQEFLTRLLILDVIIEFFQWLKKNPRGVTSELIHVWLSLRDDYRPQLFNDGIRARIVELIVGAAIRQLDVPISPERCDEILAGLLIEKEAFYKKKEATDPEAAIAPASMN